jgi:hypothetical protein
MIKRRFSRTNKRNYTAQLATADLHERFMRCIRWRILNRTQQSQVDQRRKQRKRRKDSQTEDDEDTSDNLDSNRRYNIADRAKELVEISEWVYTNRSDVATKV